MKSPEVTSHSKDLQEGLKRLQSRIRKRKDAIKGCKEKGTNKMDPNKKEVTDKGMEEKV